MLVPKHVWLISDIARIDDGDEQGLQLHCHAAASLHEEHHDKRLQACRVKSHQPAPLGFTFEIDNDMFSYAAVGERAASIDLKKEFVWCCLQIRCCSGSMPGHNIDFVELSMW